MKHYLLTGNFDWADEFNVPFIDLIDENELNNIKYGISVNILPKTVDICIGTNEYWDNGEGPELEAFNIKLLSEEDYNVLIKYRFPGHSVIDYYESRLWDFCHHNHIDSTFLTLTMDSIKFKETIDAFK